LNDDDFLVTSNQNYKPPIKNKLINNSNFNKNNDLEQEKEIVNKLTKGKMGFLKSLR
jgi:hypothetical protein